jgi:ABC-type Zn uptake system ZnuABC Zn-binding protein ZnuA
VAARAGALETSMAPLNAQMTNKMKDAKHWRDRAAEIRARAIAMEDGVSRRVMLSIAQSYEVLAQRAQEVANRSDNTAHED